MEVLVFLVKTSCCVCIRRLYAVFNLYNERRIFWTELWREDETYPRTLLTLQLARWYKLFLFCLILTFTSADLKL